MFAPSLLYYTEINTKKIGDLIIYRNAILSIEDMW